MQLKEVLIRLKEIKREIPDESDQKLTLYLKSIEELVKNSREISPNQLSQLLGVIKLERKTLKNIFANSFPLFIKYDNIYRELINIISFLMRYSKKEE